MGKGKMAEFYGVSTVTVPVGERQKYRDMNVNLNSEYLKFIHQKLKENPDICINSCAERRKSINFKFKKDLKPLYDEIKEIIDKKKKERPDIKVQFSDIYRYLFDEFRRQ